MRDRARLVHRPRFGEPPATEGRQPRAGPPAPAETAPAETAVTEEEPPVARADRDALREVQMENIHPLRLRLLLEIERTHSISAAAQACGIGQPSASMHVRNLEATLGHRLVTRSGRGSGLTPAGRVVTPHAARMLASLDSMRRAVDALGARGGGELTIAASHMPSVVLIPPVLRRLTDRHPGLAVAVRTVTSEAAVREVARGEADVGVAGDASAAEPVSRREIAVDELVGIASPGLLDSHDGWITLGHLAGHTLLVGGKASSTRTVLERGLARAGYRPTSVWELGSPEVITQTVKQGLGVSFVSRLLVGEELKRGELISFRVSGVDRMLRAIHVLQPTAREVTPEALALATMLGEANPSSSVMAAMA